MPQIRRLTVLLFFIVASPLFCDINGILIYLFAKQQEQEPTFGWEVQKDRHHGKAYTLHAHKGLFCTAKIRVRAHTVIAGVILWRHVFAASA